MNTAITWPPLIGADNCEPWFGFAAKPAATGPAIGVSLRIPSPLSTP
jgi:hypothetical protein